MTTDDTTPGTLQAQWSARLDDIERRFASIARVQADGFERALVRLGDKSRECEQLKEQVRMAEESEQRLKESIALTDKNTRTMMAAHEDDNSMLESRAKRIAALEAALRKQLLAPARWQDEDIDGHAFGPVMMICQHCGSGDENADAIEHAEDCAYIAIRTALGDAAPATPDKPAANAGVSCDAKHGPCSCGAWHTSRRY